MGNQHTSDIMLEKFTLYIKNFSRLDLDKDLCNQKFIFNGHSWSYDIMVSENDEDYLSIYFEDEDLDNLRESRSRLVNYKVSLVNQVNTKMTITKESKVHKGKETMCVWRFPELIALSDLRDPRSGFIVNDICVIRVEIAVDNSEYGGDLMDFRGLGKVEKALVPLLEEVCSWYPSLLENKKKRSRTRAFTEWGFTALGRVLHFLKTKRVNDMNTDDACKELQILWEELETFEFDLTWLEPHVQSAFEMRSYNERYEHVQLMRERVDALETELKMATRELVEAEEDFEEVDLDAELGYGACEEAEGESIGSRN